jgi:hypothetical protein
MKWPTYIGIYNPIISLADKHPRSHALLIWYENLWYDEGTHMLRTVTEKLRTEGIYSVEEASNRLRTNSMIISEKPTN